MANQTPEELFPNLFGKQPAPSSRTFAPEEMRLLQWNVRQAGRRIPADRRGNERRMVPRRV